MKPTAKESLKETSETLDAHSRNCYRCAIAFDFVGDKKSADIWRRFGKRAKERAIRMEIYGEEK